MFLRNILFNSEFLSRIDQAGRDSNTAWREWLEWMANKAKGRPEHRLRLSKIALSFVQRFRGIGRDRS